MAKAGSLPGLILNFLNVTTFEEFLFMAGSSWEAETGPALILTSDQAEHNRERHH